MKHFPIFAVAGLIVAMAVPSVSEAGGQSRPGGGSSSNGGKSNKAVESCDECPEGYACYTDKKTKKSYCMEPETIESAKKEGRRH